MNYRYELKFILDRADAAILKKQLALVCKQDPHSIGTDYSYDVRSLYFDDVFHSGYNDKINGVEFRKKYRIRIYNLSTDSIKLECKHKDNEMTYKEDCEISLETAKLLCSGRYGSIRETSALLSKFLVDASLFGLKPAVLVEYRRLAFVYPVSNVRITFDENIRSGRSSFDLFSKELKTYPIEGNDQVEMEIKCDAFMPDHIKAVLSSVDKCRVALSKFALACEVK